MKNTSWVLACAFVSLCAATADAASVGINFRRGGPNFEQNMAASESAGVVAQTNWNNSDGMQVGASNANISGPTANALVNDAGVVVPGISVNWTANGTFSAPNAGPGNLNLMSGYLDDTGTAGDTVITVTGVPYANYDVYAYLGSDANNRSGRTRLFNFVPNDRWVRTNSNPFTSFVEGTATTQPASNMGLANYTHYRSLNTSSFNLSVDSWQQQRRSARPSNCRDQRQRPAELVDRRGARRGGGRGRRHQFHRPQLHRRPRRYGSARRHRERRRHRRRIGGCTRCCPVELEQSGRPHRNRRGRKPHQPKWHRGRWHYGLMELGQRLEHCHHLAR